MVLLSHDAFLLALKSMFDQSQTKGSVFLTQKRASVRAAADSEVPLTVVLYRATNGKSQKVSTRVLPGDAARFHAAYMNVVKGSVSTLKKIEKAPAAKGPKKAAK